jgi:hypothetical protein
MMLWGLQGPALTDASKARFAKAAATSLLETILAGFRKQQKKRETIVVAL